MIFEDRIIQKVVIHLHNMASTCMVGDPSLAVFDYWFGPIPLKSSMHNPLYSWPTLSQVSHQKATGQLTWLLFVLADHDWPSVVLIDLRGPDCGSSYRQHFAAPWLRWGVGWRRWEDATPQTPETRQFWSMILLVSWISTWCDELGCDDVMQSWTWHEFNLKELVSLHLFCCKLSYFQGQRSLCGSLCARGRAEVTITRYNYMSMIGHRIKVVAARGANLASWSCASPSFSQTLGRNVHPHKHIFLDCFMICVLLAELHTSRRSVRK